MCYNSICGCVSSGRLSAEARPSLMPSSPCFSSRGCFSRHNHKYYYSTSQNRLQEVFGNLLLFYFINKNILSTSCTLDIAIWEKVCYTIVTTEEVQSNGKVKHRLWTQKTSGTQRDLNRKRDENRVRSKRWKPMCCRKVQGHSPLAFCESPQEANETNGTLVREEKKKVNRISRIHGYEAKGRKRNGGNQIWC